PHAVRTGGAFRHGDLAVLQFVVWREHDAVGRRIVDGARLCRGVGALCRGVGGGHSKREAQTHGQPARNGTASGHVTSDEFAGGEASVNCFLPVEHPQRHGPTAFRRSDMVITARGFTFLLVAAALAAPAHAQDSPEIPLREGLMVVTAIHEPGRGDYESIKRLDAIGADNLHIQFSAERAGKPITGARTVLKHDLATARKYRNYFNGNEDRAYEGWTALGPSKAVLNDLAAKGETPFTFQIQGGSDRHAIEGTIVRTGTAAYPVLLNGSRVELAAIKAEGVFDHFKVEFWFLDAPEQPLTLSYYAYRHWPDGMQEKLEALAKKSGREMPKLSEHRLDVIKIEFPPAGT